MENKGKLILTSIASLQLLSRLLANCHLPLVVMTFIYVDDEDEETLGKQSRRPCEGCATHHRLKWDPLPPNEIDRIPQHLTEKEGLHEGEKGREVRKHNID